MLLNHMVQEDRLGMTANVSELLAWFLAQYWSGVIHPEVRTDES